MIEILKYLIEGFAVAGVSHLVSKGKMNVRELVLMGLTAGLVFLVLDLHSPVVSASARQGAGFGMGWRLVGGASGALAAPGETEEVNFNIDSADEGSSKSYDVPYRLVDGVYSAKVLLAGYNEKVTAHNHNGLYAQWPWHQVQQVGGAPGGPGEEMAVVTAMAPASAPEATMSSATPVATTPVTAMPSAPSAMPSAASAMPMAETPAQPGSQPSAQEAIEILRDKNDRVAGVLYSGDLVDVISDGAYMQRGSVDSQIVFSTPLPKIGTNLSKVRLVHPKHKADKQLALNYGDPVYLMHNSYFNNSNLNRFIKYGDRLQSHQTGPLFRTFKIFDANNKSNTGPIVSGAPTIVARGDEDGDGIFLKIEGDKSVSSKNPVGSASKFTLNLKRVFEIGNKNLCVCPNEILYP